MTSGAANKLVTTILSASLAGVLIAGLTACGGGSTAQEPQTPAPSASSEVTDPAVDRPAPPVMPDQAKQPTQAGAEAFLQYWWDVVNYTFDSNDPTQLAQLSASDTCQTCSSLIDYANELASNNQTIDGSTFTVNSTELIGTGNNAYEFALTLTESEFRVLNPDGTIEESAEANSDIAWNCLVVYEKNRWVMESMMRPKK